MDKKRVELYSLLFKYLLVLRKPFADFLYKHMKAVYDDDWWSRCVLPNIKEPFKKKIDDLDLYDGNVKLESVTVSFPTEWQSVIIDPAIPAYIPEYIPATPTDTDIELPRDRVPKSARMSAEMLVTVRIIIGEGTSRERTVISRATYRYTGGELSDDPDSDHHDNDEPDFSPPMQFVDYGEWRLLRHEKVGS